MPRLINAIDESITKVEDTAFGLGAVAVAHIVGECRVRGYGLEKSACRSQPCSIKGYE